MKKYVLNGFLLLLSLGVTFGIGEIAVRLCYPLFADYNLEMWRYFAELKCPIWRADLPFVHFPSRSGHFYGVNITTNSMGLRDRECPLQKPAGCRRIVLLGDSQTLGWGVAFEDTMAKRLERALNEKGGCYEVINMGTGNYNSTMETELFKLKGLPLKPDLLVLVYFVNDTEPVPTLSQFGYEIKKRSYLFAFLYDRFATLWPKLSPSFNWLDVYRGLYQPDKPALQANRKSLDELAQLCKTNDIRLLVMNYPDLHQLKDYPLQVATDYIKGFADEHGLPFLDMSPRLTTEEPSSLWVSREDTHGNAKMNAIAAEALYDAVLDTLK